jgi:outer membrane immunogenic protein
MSAAELAAVSAKLEYLYVDLGKAHLFDIIPTVPETVSFNTNIVRAGINYRFGGPVVAKY